MTGIDALTEGPVTLSSREACDGTAEVMEGFEDGMVVSGGAAGDGTGAATGVGISADLPHGWWEDTCIEGGVLVTGTGELFSTESV